MNYGTPGPFGWLADMITRKYGPPGVIPPEPGEPGTTTIEGLAWVRQPSGALRRAWAWQGNGCTVSLWTEQGPAFRLAMSDGLRSLRLDNYGVTWAGLGQDHVEPIARWVYGLLRAQPSDAHLGAGKVVESDGAAAAEPAEIRVREPGATGRIPPPG